jgi:tetratricopeptide (TPR) repeat protein
MKKLLELFKLNKLYNNLRASNCCKTKKSKMVYCLSCIMVFFILLPSVYSNDSMINSEATKVMEAYELRINGKAEKANELLHEILMIDSTDALAYFELARTKHHLFLGGNKFSPEEWNEVLSSLKQATRYAPDNEIYAFYYAYACFFNAFISMMMQNEDVNENVALACDAFNIVLHINPDCYPAMLYLVDIYGSLPENMGGDKEKAVNLASELNNKNRLFGAIAYAKLLPDTADHLLYWQNVAKETSINAQVLEELGRAYLLKSDTDNGTKYFQEAIDSDITQRYLYMHLVRYHILSVQQNPDAKVKHLEEAEKLVNSYLQSDPDLTPPLKAYANGILALIKMIGGDNNSSNEYQEKAKSIDPFYSRAMGIPPAMLYCRPDEVKIQYSSFFMPF